MPSARRFLTSLVVLLGVALPVGAAPAPAAVAPLRERERGLCPVSPELRVAVLYGPAAADTAIELLGEFAHWDCLRLFDLPTPIPSSNGDLPEGATRIADRIGVDWIIVVTAATPGSVTARLVELSNLRVMASKNGDPQTVARGLFAPVEAEAAQSSVRVTLQLEPISFKAMKLLESDVRTLPGIQNPGTPRLFDGKGTLTVVYEGKVAGLVEALQGRPLEKKFLDVRAVKLQRIELALVDAFAPAAKAAEPDAKASSPRP